MRAHSLNRSLFFLFTALLLLLEASTARSQTAPSSTAAAPTLAPDSPAIEALNIKPTTVLRPASGPELAGDVLGNFTAGSGAGVGGVALEAAPLWLLFGDRVSIQDWREHWYNRLMSNATVSLAAAAGTNSTMQYAEGLRLTIYDAFDARLDPELDSCLVGAPGDSPALPSPVVPASGSGTADVAVHTQASILDCKAAALKRLHTHHPFGLSGAVAAAVTQTRDVEGAFKQDGVLMWGSLGVGQYFLLSANYAHSSVAGTDGLSTAARMQVEGSSLHGYLDASWTPVHDSSGWRSGRGAVDGIVELRILEPVWLQFVIGSRFGGDYASSERGFQVTGNLKLASLGQAANLF